MDMMGGSGTSFFKIMINNFSKCLRIPPAFIKHISAKSPEGFILTFAGKHWPVEVHKIGNDLYIEKGWQDFVRDHSLRHGNLLIFRYHHDFKFEVEIFERNGCEKVDDSVDRNHDLSSHFERLDPQYARKYFANDRTNQVMGSSIFSKVNGGLVTGNEGQQGSKADLRGSVAKGELDHRKQLEYCDIYIVSSSEESENDPRQIKKMKAVQHSLHSDRLPDCRRATRKSAALSRSPHVTYGKEKINQGIHIGSYSGRMNNNCKNGEKVLRRSLRLRSVQSNRLERETVGVEKGDYPVYEKGSECHEVDSASSEHSDFVESAKVSDSESSMHSFREDVLQKTSPQETEKDDYSRKSSASLERKVSANASESAAMEEAEHSVHLERHNSLGPKGSERTDENKSFQGSEYAHKSSCKHASIIGRCSYSRFASRRRSVTQEERDRAIMASRSFNSNEPFFIVVLKPTHVYRGFTLSIPSLFVEAHIFEKIQKVLLTTSSNRKWLVKCHIKKHNQAKLGKGWASFVWENNLEEGDACVFELDKSNDFSFRVHIFRVVEEVVPLCRNRK